MQPIQIFDPCLGKCVLPEEQYHDFVRPLQEPSKMFVAPIPSDAEKLSELLLLERVDFARAPCGLFAAVHLELRQQTGDGYLVLVDAWSIRC